MRLALLGFSHETNTFAPTPADFLKFEESGIWRGEEIIQRARGGHSTLSGFIEAAERFRVELVPLIFFHTEPTGMITRDAFERIAGKMLQLLREHAPWDGILLAQHGAAVSEEYHDADGEIAARVRELVGPGVPVGMAIDMHANLTQKMVEHTTAIVSYRTNPHLDACERAYECAEIIVRTIQGKVRPVQALETPPLVINILKQFTGEEPMRSLIRDVEEVIARPGMLSASALEGYPYADVPEMGASFLAVHNGDLTAARAAARWLAWRAWERRAEFVGDAPSPRQALEIAAAAPKGPVVLMDVGDNIGGGSPGDSTVLLAEAKRLGIRRYLQTLYDPQAVQACLAAGPGATVTLQVGAKTDRLHGKPVEVTGRVRVITDGRFEDPRPTHGGARFFNAGITVVLETTDEHTLVLTSRRIGNTSIEQMYSAGVQPERYQVVVAKGVHSPRPAYAPIAAQIILVNTPGVTSADLSRFHYRNRRRPLYPFEPEATYQPEGSSA